MFLYKPGKKSYDFELEQDDSINVFKPNIVNVSIDINQNKQYMKELFNTDINNDIITRDIVIYAGDKKRKAVLYSVDGLVNKQLINENILEPLMRFKDSGSGKTITAD